MRPILPILFILVRSSLLAGSSFRLTVTLGRRRKRRDEAQGEAARLLQPLCVRTGDPSCRIEDVQKVLLEIAHENGLMMGNPVSEGSDGVQTIEDVAAKKTFPLRTSGLEGAMQANILQGGLIAFRANSHPEAK